MHSAFHPIAALLLSVAVEDLEVATDDGLALSIDSTGRVASCRVDNRDLPQHGPAGGFFVADVADIPAQDLEQIANPSFEEIEDDMPVGWAVGRGWSVDRGTARSGKRSMKVSIPSSREDTSGNLSVDVPVAPNTPYRISMWLRTEGGAPSLYIQQLDEGGQPHPDYPQMTASHSRRQSDWFELTRSLTTSFFCRTIRVRTNLWRQAGNAWIDDVSVVCLDDDYLSPQRLVAGTVHRTPTGLEQICDLEDLALRIHATYAMNRDYIIVDGDIQDTSGRDRAVSLSFRLPVNGAGWTWFDDLQNVQVVEEELRYGSARLMGRDDPTQRRTIALYPFAAMADSQSGLALAVPMDMPRAVRLCYAADLGFLVNYEFGLTQATSKFPRQASFRFFIYRIDPRWGFRSAADRYYQHHRDFFTKRTDPEGGIGPMVVCDREVSRNQLIPALADFKWSHRHLVACNHRELVKLLQYSEFIGWWGSALGIGVQEAEHQVTQEEAWAHVEDVAFSDHPQREVARCILNCALHDREGRRRLHWNYVPRWGGYHYLCNPDPDITGIGGRVNRYTLTRDREMAKVAPYGLDGMRFDGPIGFATDNFRREHFQWADHPLAFDHVSKKPVMPLDFSAYECAQAIADDMHRGGKLVASNYSTIDDPSDIFHIQLLDVVGNEMLGAWTTNAKLALQRTLAHQKTVVMSWQEVKRDWPPERIEREMKQAMFYGTFYYLSDMDPALYERWHPLTQRLAAAGWEPISHASTDSPAILVERFGRIGDRNLHFTLRNEGTPDSCQVRFDALALGLNVEPMPTVWWMWDAQTHVEIAARRIGAHWSAKLPLPEDDTVVLRIATASGVALDHLFGVRDHLQRAYNYRRDLEQVGVTATSVDYERVADELDRAIAALRSKAPEVDHVRELLTSMSKGLSDLTVNGEVPDHKDWVMRQRVACSEVRSGLDRAAGALGARP